MAAALALFVAEPAAAQTPVRAIEGYADLADLTLASPIILQANIAKAERLNRKTAPDVAAGRVRMLVTARVESVVVSPQAVPGEIRYLWEGPLDARGKPPKLKGVPVLLFLRPGAKPGDYQLANAAGQVAVTPTALQTVRAVVAQSRQTELRGLRVTGIGNAFHVRGSVPGESESQIFVSTADGRPVSLVVLNRPGQAPTYAVATGDVIDESAKPVPPRTLVWYEFACRLPRSLPPAAVEQLAPEDARAVATDYQFVLQQLGPCGRTLS
jgi:hypothetical protein